MASRTNTQSRARRRAGRRLMEVIEHYGLDLRLVSRDTGIDLVTLKNLRNFTPHLHTIEKISIYLEGVARERRATARASAAVAGQHQAMQAAF